MTGCPVEEHLSAFLDDEVAPPERRSIEEHVADCPDCAALLDSLRAVEALTAELAAEPVTDAEWESAWVAVQARIAPRLAQRLVRLLVPLAAAAVLLLGIGLWMYFAGPGQPTQASVVEPDCLVDRLETAEGYTSMYQEAEVTIITLLPESPEEALSPDDTL
jgi:anti-sigma factor RsiW